jgi:thiopeptide-type bacteriocin biosynthesis protein
MLDIHPAVPGHAAGIGHWHEVCVRFGDHDMAERLMATVLAPRLSRLAAEGTLTRWCFMRQPPLWRIRLEDPDMPAVIQLLDELAADGTITGWQGTLYEPGTNAFGGAAGMDIAHDLFCADTTGVMDYLRRDPPPIGRPELSLLLISAMLDAAGLDWPGRGDVYAWVAAMRPAPPHESPEDTAKLTGQLRTLLTVPTQDVSPLFTEGGTLEFAAHWHGAFETAGHRLARATISGRLGRGLRVILAHAMIFHWNRLGLPAATQSLLAQAAVDAYLLSDGP